jgi:retron-type reverse transcriptase
MQFEVIIPTVSDRIVQTVVSMYLEPLVEPHFHPDSYGYRPKKSALQAVEVARERCWCSDWIIDLDIRGFFENLDHVLITRGGKVYGLPVGPPVYRAVAKSTRAIED